jgi:hypothetical protein
MDAAKARAISELHTRDERRVRDSLVNHALCLVEAEAKKGKRQITNPFSGLRMMKSALDEQDAYAVLEQKGFSVMKLGDLNTVISW